MLYFMYCGYLGLFKLSLGKLYGMHPNKRTDQSSLLFSGSLLLRVFSPLTYNFVTMYNLDADAFKGVVGNITVFPFFGEQFNQFLPILVAVVAVMNITNVFGKALKCIGVQFFERDESFEDDTIAEGKLLLRRAKHKLEVETETKSSDELSLL
jgi:hypothetical protein